MKLGICAYPLTRGKQTGRGLERAIEEFCEYLGRNDVPYDFYHRGMIRNEIKAVLQSVAYAVRLAASRNSCYFGVYVVAGMFPAVLRKRPLVTIVTDLIPFHVAAYDNRLKYAIKRLCARLSCRFSDLLIVGSASIKDEVVSRFRVPAQRVFIVPWGVDHKAYFRDPAVRKIPLRVAFLGEAKRAKGIDAVINAFRFVVEQIPEATLVIGGSGRDLAEMKKLAQRILPEHCYSFAGFIPESQMRQFYSSADVFVFPSRYGFGLSALEAMACGTPALVGNTLDARDFFFDEDLLVDPDDDQQIAGKVVSLLTNAELKARKGRQAIEFARRFSWDNMSEQYLAVCQRAIASKKTHR